MNRCDGTVSLIFLLNRLKGRILNKEVNRTYAGVLP
jgi:hypothetical protein